MIRVPRMAAPTQLDRIEASLVTIRNQNTQQTALLLATLAGDQLMSQTADDTKAAVDSLDTKVDNLIAAIQPGIQALRDQLATAQAQLAALQAGQQADMATLGNAIEAAQSEAAKVDAAIAALTPIPPPAG